ncbi:MAG TPA: WD40 repeat domain-containing protein [Gemmataceae bacterium]|nr:WD40 repeat domain-containing protein [Gemmataceae bacterium]
MPEGVIRVLRERSNNGSRPAYPVFSPSGQILAVSRTPEVELWDVAKGSLLSTLGSKDQPIGSFAFLPETDLCVTMRGGLYPVEPPWPAEICNVRTGKSLWLFQPAKSGSAAPDGKTFAVADGGYTVRIWDMTSKTIIKRLTGHTGYTIAPTFSPDGNLLATTASDRTLRLWHAGKGVLLHTLAFEEDGPIPLRFSPDGSYLIFYEWRKCTLTVVEIVTGQRLSTIKVAKDPKMDTYLMGGATFADNGTLLQIAFRVVKRRFETTFHYPVHAFNMISCKMQEAAVDYGGDLLSAEFSKDGRTLALAFFDGGLFLCKSPPFPKRTSLSNKLTPAEVNALWMSLAGPDPKAAYDARWRLIAAPKQTLQKVRGQLKPAQFDAEKVAAWIERLGSDSFKVREAAFQQLESMGETTELALRKALEQKTSLEMKQRVELLLNSFMTSEG